MFKWENRHRFRPEQCVPDAPGTTVSPVTMLCERSPPAGRIINYFLGLIRGAQALVAEEIQQGTGK